MSTQGRPCERLPTQFVKDCGYIPVVLTNAAYVIEKNLKTKGLFQTQGNVSKVNACLNHLLAPRLSKIKHENVHDVIEAIKAFLVRLPEPLMPESVCDALISRSQDEDSSSQYVAVLTKFRHSSPHSFAILQFMMLLLKRISEYSEYNTMEVRKLATVFVLDIIKPLKLEDSNEGLFLIERMQRLPYLIMVVENIIKRVDIFQIINNTAGYQPSQRDSPIVMECSNSNLPPTGYKSSSSEMYGLTHAKPEGNEHTTVAFAEQNDVGGGFQFGQMKDRRNELNERVLPKPAELVTRAASEPQKETAYTVDICKRCVTALPACSSGVVSETAGSTGDAGGEGSITTVTVQETSIHSIAATLGPSEDKYSAGLFNAADVAHRKIVSRASILGSKKLSTPRGSTSSPIRRKSIKKDQDDPFHNLWELKSHRSMDTSVSATQNKRKRKCRCTSKKSKRDQDRSLGETSYRGSDFTTFQPDEEITPWNEGSTNSDDTSVMVKTIRNPRVLAQAASSPVKFETQVRGENVHKLKDNMISSENVTRLFLANYGFRTISSQNNLAHMSGSSRTTSSSDTSFCVNMMCPTPDVCEQSTSNETTLISKELIRGVKLKGSIGVNTSPCLELSAAEIKIDDIQKAPEKPKEVPIAKIPTTSIKEIKPSPRTSTAAVNKSTVTATTKTTPTAPTTTEMSTRLRAPVNGIPPSSNSFQQHYPRLSVPSQLSISGRGDRYSSHIKLRQQQLRRTLKSSSSFLEQKTRRNATSESFIPSLFTREWFVDMFLAFITVLFISFIFFFYEQDKHKGSWLK